MDSDKRQYIIVVAVVLSAFVTALVFPAAGMVIGLSGFMLGALLLLSRHARARMTEILPRRLHSGIGPLFAALLSAFSLTTAVIAFSKDISDRRRAERATNAALEAARADAAAQAHRQQEQLRIPGLIDEIEERLEARNPSGAYAILQQVAAIDATDKRYAALLKRANEVAESLRREEFRVLIATAQAHVEAKAWTDASKACLAAAELIPAPIYEEPACRAAAEYEREQRQIAEREEREAEVRGWITRAKQTTHDRRTCRSAPDVLAAWQDLSQVKVGEPGFSQARKAASALERCRRQIERDFVKVHRDALKAQRERWARETEKDMLLAGHDVRVTLRGKLRDRARIEWILVSRPAVYQLINMPGYIARMEDLGLRKLTFTDGFYESYSVDLNPIDDASGGAIIMRDIGLGEPLRL